MLQLRREWLEKFVQMKLDDGGTLQGPSPLAFREQGCLASPGPSRGPRNDPLSVRVCVCCVVCPCSRLVSGAAYMSLCWVRRRPRVCVEGARGVGRVDDFPYECCVPEPKGDGT